MWSSGDDEAPSEHSSEFSYLSDPGRPSDDEPLPDSTPSTLPRSSDEDESPHQLDWSDEYYEHAVYYEHPEEDPEEQIRMIQDPAPSVDDVLQEQIHLPAKGIPRYGILGLLNNRLLVIYRCSRVCINHFYRACSSYNHNGFIKVGQFKIDQYNELISLRDGDEGFLSTLTRISELGGPYFLPSVKLWNHIHYLCYQNISVANVNYVPWNYVAPSILSWFDLPPASLDRVVDALKTETFEVPVEFLKAGGNDSKAMCTIFQDMSVLVEKVHELRSGEMSIGLPMLDKTAGFYLDLMDMKHLSEEMNKHFVSMGRSRVRMPRLLVTALSLLREVCK